MSNSTVAINDSDTSYNELKSAELKDSLGAISPFFMPFRWLSKKFQAGGFSGSVLELLSAIIGAGVLALPYAFG